MEKKKDAFETVLKFGLMGLAGVILASGLAFKDDLINSFNKAETYGSIIADLKTEIKKGIGVLGESSVNIKTGVEYQNSKNNWGSFSSTDNISKTGICDVILAAGGNLEEMTDFTSFSGATKNQVKEINSLISTSSARKNVITMTGIHEIYHCDEEVLNRRFDMPGFNELSNSLNSLYKGSPIRYTSLMIEAKRDKNTAIMNGNLDTLLSEGYAEAASTITMVQKIGDDSNLILKHRQLVTGAARVVLMANSSNVIVKHSTDGINDYYRTPEGIAEAKSLTGVSAIREASIQRANQNILEVLKSRNNIKELFGDAYWKKETLNAWKSSLSMKEKGLSNTLSPLMEERVNELKTKINPYLKEEFEKAVIAEESGKDLNEMLVVVAYSAVLHQMPTLNAGQKEIEIIKRDLPIAVSQAKSKEIYSVNSIDELIKHSERSDIKIDFNVTQSKDVVVSSAIPITRNGVKPN